MSAPAVLEAPSASRAVGEPPRTLGTFENRCTHRRYGADGAVIGWCALPLRFVGIRGGIPGGTWSGERRRWYVGDCGFYTVVNDAGTIVNMTREEPPRGYFNHAHEECKKRRSFGCVLG